MPGGQQFILEPEKILRNLHLARTATIADFGCGPGIFSLVAATMTQGTVYCFDVLPSALDILKSKAKSYQLSNIVAKRVNLEQKNGSTLSDASVDLVMMRKILLQNEDKAALFAEAFRILKDDGILLIVGWTPEATIGPDPAVRIPKESLLELAQTAGFRLEEEYPTDNAHYALTLIKNHAK